MLTKPEAISKIGRALGRSKFHNYMEGAMISYGGIETAEVLRIIYGGSYYKIKKELEDKEQKAFKWHLKKMR